MGLFDMDREAPVRHESLFAATPGAGVFMNAASLKYFKSIISTLKRDMHYHFISHGQWSLHELIIYLLSITGAADVWKCTWAISEDPVRAMIDLKNRNIIRSIKCIFNFKVTDQKSQAYLLARENFDHITLAKCHAKVTVIKNDDWCITVFGSANDTRNPRIERGVVCTVPEIAQFDIDWMEAVMRDEKIFKVRK